MKRFYCFALVLLTLLASVYFSACGNKYKNLNMQFVNVDGEQVSSVELVIDANNPEKAQARLGVKFSGIKTADIGNVSVWCVEGKAIVSNASFSGDTYYFTLSAENVSNIGADKVKVIHLSSKKEIELDLSIGKKATTLSANKKNYIISIPYQASRTMSVDASLLVNIDGTDEVGLVLDTTSFDTGLTATYKTVGGVSMLDKFTITSDLEDGYNVLAHPVCFMDGYDVLYADEPTSPEQNNLVNLVFKKVLNDDSVVITTDADHTSDANGVYDGSEIILISNDHTAVKDYRYDTFSVELSHIDPITGEIGRIDNVNKNYLNYYQYELISSDENIYAHIENNLIYIQALSRTDSATVEICLNPKNSVGEIESVSKIVKVRGETKPEGISIKMQGKDVSGKVDLYDTYANSRAGARFEFIPDDAFIDLQQMQIMLSPTILNTKNGNLGVNEVYYDENFEQLQDLDEVANARQNAYLLDFYFNSQNQPIKFYYDSLNERFISETILSTSQVFIKYEENPNYSASSPISQLEISLTTKYSGNLPYLEGIAGCDEVSLVFENQQGVADTNIFDGHINKPAGVAEIIDYANQVGELGVDNVGKDSFSQTIELNRNNGVDNDNGMGAYVIYIREVVGDKSNNILSTKFSVSVSGGKDNPLKIKQFDLLLDGNGKLDPSQGSTEISEFNYNKNDSVNNSILLLFNSSTDVGEYTITITHGNGYEKTITAHIIVSPSVEDFKDAIIHNIKENEENDNSAYNYINRRADGSYKYDVEADFIVATNVGVSGRNVEFAISLNDNILNSGVVVPNSYACSAKANGDRFIQISPRRNDPTLFDLVFKEGSKVDGVDYVVEVEFKVSIFTYAYLAKQEDVTQDLTCSFTFFIYEPVENEDIELSPSTSAITRYPYEYLGAYYKDYANLDLSLTIDDNLKQYLHIPTFNAVGVNGFETYSVLGEQGKNVLWLSSQPVASGDDLEQEDYSLVTNIHGVGLVNQRVEIYGFVRQYSRTIFKGFVVIIERPIVSDRVEISTNLDVNQAGQYLYLNLKDKEVKKIDASSYSETGNQTFGNDVVMVAVDGGGNTIATSALEIDNDSSEIIVNGMVNGARLLVFAKDALYQTITSGQQIYPDEFLLDGHKGAYQEFNLLLSDGSEKNPFIVKNADDFWAMRTDENSRGVYYSLLANINLNTANEQKSPLPNLYANFSSYEMEGETYVYSIYGITLNNSFRNLIGGVYGSISNINFEYTAAYSGAVEGNLGLIAENRGTLTNVSLNISGNAQLQSGSVFFGGLVGANYGVVSYTTASIVGVSGSIEVSGEAEVHFGSVAGVNTGTLYYQTDATHRINLTYARIKPVNYAINVLSVVINDMGAMASIDILASGLTNEMSSVGGVVGLNQMGGSIKNAFVTGSIRGNNRVGGIIGQNATNKLIATVTTTTSSFTSNPISKIDFGSEDGFAFSNLKTNASISGNDYVGGIVGYDEGGSYIDCKIQFVAGQENSISGHDYVGGIAGYSRFGVFNYCSVMSYKWDYSNLTTTFDKATKADISGNNYVAGAIGYAVGFAEDTQYHNDGTYNTSDADGVTIISSCSVNALLAASGSSCWGVCYSENYAIIFNAYFVGKITNSILEDKSFDFAVSNDSSIHYYVYSVNVFNSSLQISKFGAVPNEGDAANEFDITSVQYAEFWAKDDTLNGGYIYLTHNNEPIFELAPSSLVASAKTQLTNENGALIPNLLHLEIRKFNLDATTPNYQLIRSALNEKFNRYRIEDCLNIEADIEGARISIEVIEGTDVISIYGDGYINVLDIGQAKIVLYPVLNPMIRCEIIVDVSAPIGNFVISTSNQERDSIASTTQNIAKGKGKQYVSVSSGSEHYLISGSDEQVEYEYETDKRIYLDVQVEYLGEQIEGFDLNNYISISENRLVGGKTSLNPSQPFSIQVIEQLDGELAITIQPYLQIEFTSTVEDAATHTQREETHTAKIDYEDTISFKLKTYRGPSQINLTYEEVNLYPTNSTIVSALITTDLPLTDEELAVENIISAISVADENNATPVQNVADYVEFVQASHELVGGVQEVKYRVKFSNELHIEEPKTLTIIFSLEGAGSKSVTFNLFPQLIHSLKIENYTFNEDGQRELNNILRPDRRGLMIISVYPDNGYYKYLNILDPVSGEEVLFTQLTGLGGTTMPRLDVESATGEGKGIRLEKIAKAGGGYEDKIYVSTTIDQRYTSRIHQITVVAYDDFGQRIASAVFDLDIKMKPQVTMDYVDPNGVHLNNSDNVASPIYLANNVPASLDVTVRNADTEPSISGEFVDVNGVKDSSLTFEEYFDIVNIVGSRYELQWKKGLSDDLLGKRIKLTAETSLTLNNGTVETAETSLIFRIARFVIHNISVNSSRVNFAPNQYETTRILYGDYAVPMDLIFYLSPTDISYYDNYNYWTNSYLYNPDLGSSVSVSEELIAINSILRALNTQEALSYEYVQLLKNGEPLTDTNVGSISFIEGQGLSIIVNSNDDGDLALKLNVSLALDESNYCWEVNQYSGTQHFNYSYRISFDNSTSFLEPKVIKNEDDFMNMSNSGTINYILGNDLVFEEYTPIDVNVASFDGNGRKIIIKSFAGFNDTDIRAGLFEHIYPNMLVSNLEVIYLMDGTDRRLGFINGSEPITGTEYFDLCTNSNITYSTAYFGGLAAVNEGIVTNCTVSGGVAIRATAFENSTQIANFNIGGLVCVNSGYITNSISRLAIAGFANIGGLVYQNNAKIASCAFDASEEFSLEEADARKVDYHRYNSDDESIYINKTGYILAHNRFVPAIESNITANVGGFAVENSGSTTINNRTVEAEISMSYVKAGTTNSQSNIFARNSILAGFVRTNSSKINDCYVIFDGAGSATFSGFVSDNAGGTISTCYTNINSGDWHVGEYPMFTQKGSTAGTISNSIEIINLTISEDFYNLQYKTPGVSHINTLNSFYQDSYQGFMFGDNANGVWQILPNSTPTLVSTQVEVKYNGALTSGQKNRYVGLRMVEVQEDEELGTEKTILYDNGYGLKNNPIIIYDLRTWNYYFKNDTNRFFRLVADFNFEDVGVSPETSTRSFSGNIQGNDMTVDNLMIFSSNNLEAIGLFRDLKSSGDATIPNVVANLRIKASSILASNTQAVGMLAGIVDGFRVYHIELDSNGSVILGRNAVGGLAGLIRGSFDLDGVVANVSVNSESKLVSNSYSIYMSTNNGKESNLKDVYYAGAVAGILDGVSNSNFNINAVRNVNSGYIEAKNLTANGDITVIGKTVGSLVGLVGERVKLVNSHASLTSGSMQGGQISGGLVGENRGVIENCSFEASQDVFGRSKYVSGGLVGLNLGGLIKDSRASATIVMAMDGTTVGGLVGRSVNGYVINSSFSGELKGYFTGGLIGAAIDKTVFTSSTAGAGSINSECRDDKVIPSEDLRYLVNDREIKFIENSTITLSTLTYMVDNLKDFYTFTEGRPNLNLATESKAVLGIAVGTVQTNDFTHQFATNEYISKYGYDDENRVMVFNGDFDIDTVGMVDNASLGGAVYDTPFANIINSVGGISGTNIMYVVGAKITAFNTWSRTYSDEMVIITSDSVNELKLCAYKADEKKELTPLTSIDERDKYKIHIYSSNGTDYNILTNDVLEFEPDITPYYAIVFDIGYMQDVGSIDDEQFKITSGPEGQLTSKNAHTLVALFALAIASQVEGVEEETVTYSYSAITKISLNFNFNDLAEIAYTFNLIN